MSLRESKGSATRKTDEAMDTEVNQDQGDTEIDEVITPGAQRAQSGSKERASTAASVEDVEDDGSDNEDDDEEQSHQEPARVVSNPIPVPAKAIKQTRFGLKNDEMSGKKKEEELNDPLSSTFDYTKKYPRDKRYEELHNDARVWRTYNDEAAIFDTEMVGEAADSLDILLVFAGLFSAVLTTFVAQTSQSLSTDKAAVTVSLLVELVAVQRAGFAGGSLSDIAPADIAPADIAPAIARTDVWVNALWFTSLALSLASALLAVLSKQWLRQYISFIKGSARERALIRQFRYDGMEKWAVRTIIGLLPTILHIALGLFLAGLVVFLAPLQRGIATSVGTISGALFVAYAASIVVAIVHVESPYRTTFSDILSTTLRWTFTVTYPFFQTRLALREIELAPTARAAEQKLAVCLDEHPGATQACNALRWLHSTTGSMSAKTLIMNSLGAFPPKFFDGYEKQAIFVQLSKGCGPNYADVYNWRDNFPQKTAHDFELMLRILWNRPNSRWVYADADIAKDHLGSDVGLTVACAAFIEPPHFHFRIGQNFSEEDRSARRTALRGLFSEDASNILSLLPLDDLSYVGILYSLGSAPPGVWSNLVQESPWFERLSPRHLDDWPSHEVDLRAYLFLIDYAHCFPQVQSLSVFQNPVNLSTVLYPIFKNLGWYNLPDDALMIIRNFVPPPFDDTINNEDDGNLIGDSPPPDDDTQVWEPAVYPPEWPPFPAPTYVGQLKAVKAEEKAWVAESRPKLQAQWEAALAESKMQEAEAEREAKREQEKKAREAAELKALLAEFKAAGGVAGEEERETERAEVEGGFWGKIQKLVRAKLQSGGERTRDTDIEMQEV